MTAGNTVNPPLPKKKNFSFSQYKPSGWFPLGCPCNCIFELGCRSLHLNLVGENLMIPNTSASAFRHLLYSLSLSSMVPPDAVPVLSKSSVRLWRACIHKEGDITPKEAKHILLFLYLKHRYPYSTKMNIWYILCDVKIFHEGWVCGKKCLIKLLKGTMMEKLVEKQVQRMRLRAKIMSPLEVSPDP